MDFKYLKKVGRTITKGCPEYLHLKDLLFFNTYVFVDEFVCQFLFLLLNNLLYFCVNFNLCSKLEMQGSKNLNKGPKQKVKNQE